MRFMARKNKSFPSCSSFSPVVAFVCVPPPPVEGGWNTEELVLFHFILFSANTLFSQGLRGEQRKSQS